MQTLFDILTKNLLHLGTARLGNQIAAHVSDADGVGFVDDGALAGDEPVRREAERDGEKKRQQPEDSAHHRTYGSLGFMLLLAARPPIAELDDPDRSGKRADEHGPKYW